MLCPGDLADEGQNHKATCSLPSLYSSCCLSPTCDIKTTNQLSCKERGVMEGGREGEELELLLY